MFEEKVHAGMHTHPLTKGHDIRSVGLWQVELMINEHHFEQGFAIMSPSVKKKKKKMLFLSHKYERQ